MVDGSALFIKSVYKPYLAKGRDDAHYLRVARVTALMITIAGFLIGMMIPSVVTATIQFVTILPFVGVCFWVGVIWPRANRYGAWASTIGAAVVFAVTKNLGYSTAWASLWSLAYGFVSIVVVSRLTAPEPEENMVRIFAPLYTPVGEEQRLIDMGLQVEGGN
jgi:Na+/proline symporter